MFLYAGSQKTAGLSTNDLFDLLLFGISAEFVLIQIKPVRINSGPTDI